MKNIVLKLRAAPGCNGVSLYFTKWGCRAYPYGLVPGAQVCAMFVSKHESRSSSFTYFQTTEFTTIEVLHIPHTVDINTVSNTCSRPLASWGDICILGKDAEYAAAGSILWGTFSTIKILTLMATTSCSKCGSFFRSGCCVGCNLYPASPKLSVTAACCIEDSFGKILIFMKDDQVCQLLGLSKPYWDVLTKVISHDGSKIELPQSQWNPEDPIGKQVLQALLKTVEIRQLPFHILCRKMNVNKTDTMYADMPKLNCLQLQKPRPPFSFSVFKKGISQP
ncbi:hypothetical protein B7P43_G04292 [Cryptotermes secundus]|uniref:CST complex subunit CTC1 n=2 Tax=Cryptotermes secundus TaxID=105785 RepID=A0A2J7QFX2_9NEOP|nr:hypothetical protein B7P43_G04292 [Cryptotermes secundus]